MKKIISCAITLFLLTSLISAADDIWLSDIEAAKKEAAKNKKDILINFTGSDWCGWCIRLDKEVFSTKTFKEKAPKEFVLVKLDFPRKEEQAEEIKKKNRELAQKYGVGGFPSIVLTNADGEIYGKTGYEEGGPEKYLEHLETFQAEKKKSDQLFEKAKKAEGLEKAKLLDKALTLLLENGIQRGHEETIETIKKLDKDNKAGLKLKYELPEKLKAIWMQAAKTKDADTALTESKKLIKLTQTDPELLQQVYLFQTDLHMKFKQDKKAALESLKKAHKTAPDSRIGKNLPEYIKQLENQVNTEESKPNPGKEKKEQSEDK